MKMKNSSRLAACSILALLMAAGTASARSHRPEPHSRPLPPEPQAYEGKLFVSGDADNAVVSLLTQDNKTYVLTSLPKPPREEFPEEDCDYGKRKGPHHDKAAPMNRDDRPCPIEPVSVRELAKLDGQHIALKGFLNKDSNVLLVMEVTENQSL